MNDFLIAVKNPPEGATVLAEYRLPVQVRGWVAAFHKDKLIVIGYHPEYDKRLTIKLGEWITSCFGF